MTTSAAVSMAVSSTLTTSRAMRASRSAAATNFVRRQLAELAEACRLEDLANRSKLREQDIDASLLEAGEGPTAYACTGDGVDIVGPQSIDMVAGPRVGVEIEILQDLQVAAIDFHNRKERRTAEMVEQLRLKSQVILRRDTDLHDELLPR